MGNEWMYVRKPGNVQGWLRHRVAPVAVLRMVCRVSLLCVRSCIARIDHVCASCMLITNRAVQ